MKKLSLAILLLFTVVLLNGQAPFPKKDEIKQFTESKTCVVLEDQSFSPYNSYIKEAVKAYWKITPYEFISVEEFNKRRIDPAFSFIVLTQTDFEKDKSNSQFNFINLLQGKKVSRLGEMPEICAIPLSFADDEDIEYNYKLGGILLFMQKHAQMISDDPSLTGRKYLKYYNKNIPQIQGKTLLIKEEDLVPEISSLEAINAIYSGKVKIVSEDEIVDAIESKAPGILILHKVGPFGDVNSGFCFKMLIGTEDSDMYYYNQHTISNTNPNGFLPADLKRIAR